MADEIENTKFKMGWLRDLPDPRDYAYTARPEVLAVLPPSADLRTYDTPIENQGSYGSCVAHAATGIFEFLQKKLTGKFVQGSRFFVYKGARNYAGITGDNGAYLRDGAKVMANMGVPPELLWPYTNLYWDAKLTDPILAEAIKSHADSYWRLDPVGTSNAQMLNNIKAAISDLGLPVMFGFTCYNSIFNVGSSGMVPIPYSGEAIAGGHAVAAMGYDDVKQAVLIRNSWGPWGMNGYGWLPYWYFLNGLVSDCWLVATESQIVGPTPPPPPLKETIMTLNATV